MFKPDVNQWYPSEDVWVDEWADTDRILTSETSAEVGKWDTNRTPYLRKIMQVLSPQHPARRVVFRKSVQVGGTEVGVNAIGHRRKHDPTTILVVLPTEESAKTWSKSRISTMFESSFGDAKVSRSGADTIFQKDFPGGSVKVASASSPASLKSNAVDLVIIDEADEFPVTVGSQGCPIALVDARQRNYVFSKMYIVSSPTDIETSRINREFLESNQQFYYVPCPACDFMQDIDWSDLNYQDDDPKSVVWVCRSCGVTQKESAKSGMLEKGDWIEHNPGHAIEGFHINAFYSPWFTWADCVDEWLKAQKDRTRLPTFTNTIRGLPTTPIVISSPKWESLYDRRETYGVGTVPAGVCLLTMAVDVQGDRIEYEVMGWGYGFESWSIDFGVIEGSPYDARTWDKLESAAAVQYPTQDGHMMGITKGVVDTGYATVEVYNFLRRYAGTAFMIGVKGQDSLKGIIANNPSYLDFDYKGQRYKGGAMVWSVGSSIIKQQIYGLLELEKNEDGTYPAGYCHFPEYGVEYFEQLTAEQQRLVKNRKGYMVRSWVKTRDRNEALDTRVYNRAAIEMLGAAMWQEHHWEAYRTKLTPQKQSDIVAARKVEPVQSHNPMNLPTGTDFWGR